ncbi:MAG TPA: hypothetical protein VEK06_00815 [Myxococcota bacterium]|nr:hypothetical protein [Myxococcota bacterium]
MKRTFLAIIGAVFALSFSHSSFALHFPPPKEDLSVLCKERLTVLKGDLKKVLKKSNYSRKYQANVKAKMEGYGVSEESYKKSLADIEEIVHKNEDIAATKCVLMTSETILMLDAIAVAGHKNLDHFSTTWKRHFPNHAKKLGYVEAPR